jgi:heterodisulfide reductase subunit B
MAKRNISAKAAKHLQSLRKNRRGGRPAVMTPCPYCEVKFNAADFRKHLPRCPAKPKKAA